MKRFHYLFLVIVAVLAANAFAERAPEEPVPDVRAIIDISGSMKQNDPDNLRRPAMELLIQLFPEASKAGVWTFGQWVNMLVKHQIVDDQWRQEALQRAQKINSVALHTNIATALEKAVDDIDRLDPNYQTSLVLLTDGMVDIAKDPEKNAASRQQILNEILPKLTASGVRIHTVALSQNADKDLMERMALESGGLFAVAETAEDLTRIFLQAFDASAPAEQLPLTDNRFLVDSSVEEFTALIFRKDSSPEAVLVGPDKKEYRRNSSDKDVKWFSQENYDLITVSRPYEGEWRIVADLEPDSRITVVSDLSLIVDRLPINQYVDDRPTITGSLQEKGKPIVRNELLSLVEVTVNVLREADKKEWVYSLTENQPTQSDGVFSTQLSTFEEPGAYKITMVADGKTFVRQQTQRVVIRHPFEAAVKRKKNNGLTQFQITLTPQNHSVNLQKTSVIAQVTRPDQSNQMKPGILNAEGRWEITEKPNVTTGEYQVVFVVDGEYNDGKKLFYRTESLRFSADSGSVVTAPEPEIKVEPEPMAEPEPEPKAAPELKPEPEQQAKEEPKPIEEKEPAEDKSVPIWLWAAIIGGNIMIFGLAFLAYKMIMGDKKSNILDEDDFIEEDETAPEPEPEAEPEPELEVEETEGNDSEAITEDSSEVEVVEDATEKLDQNPSDDADDLALPEEEVEEGEAEDPLEDDDLGLPDDIIDLEVDSGSDKKE